MNLPTESNNEALGGIVADNAELAQVWEAHGLTCAILPGPGGMNGYVRMPESFRSRKLCDDDISYEEVDVHGGLTWGMDEGGWVGFDTSHSGDVWIDPDTPEFEFDKSSRELSEKDPHYAKLHERTAIHKMRDPNKTVWTLERLRAEVEDLARQLVAWCIRNPHFHGTMTPKERQEKSRKQLREIGRLVQDEGLDYMDAITRVYGGDE